MYLCDVVGAVQLISREANIDAMKATLIRGSCDACGGSVKIGFSFLDIGAAAVSHVAGWASRHWWCAKDIPVPVGDWRHGMLRNHEGAIGAHRSNVVVR